MQTSQRLRLKPISLRNGGKHRGMKRARKDAPHRLQQPTKPDKPAKRAQSTTRNLLIRMRGREEPQTDNQYAPVPAQTFPKRQWLSSMRSANGQLQSVPPILPDKAALIQPIPSKPTPAEEQRRKYAQDMPSFRLLIKPACGSSEKVPVLPGLFL